MFVREVSPELVEVLGVFSGDDEHLCRQSVLA